MLTSILIVVGVLVVLFVIIVAMQPATFRITRSATIAASPQAVFAQVNELRKWAAWSPWEKLDPAMKKTYEGPAAGTGAVSAWAGNQKAGEGRMTIVESRAGEFIRIKLEFFKPFQATNEAEFTFKPEGKETVVNWSMTGAKNFMFKAVHLIMNMEKMVGGDFERGLAQLKTIVEAENKN